MMLRNKKAQVAIFVIIALVIVSVIIIYFALKGGVSIARVDPEFVPVYDFYSNCISEKAEMGISIAGSQGGRIDMDYVPGSEYAPSSNQLNFLGFPVPYWMYVSGNGIVRENVPSRQEIENEIGAYVEEKIDECDFSKFYQQGMNIEFGNPDVTVSISDNNADVNVGQSVLVSKDEKSSRKGEFDVSLNSKIGKFYNIALQIYNREKKEAFLENYSIDVLRMYAPVDGVELSCGPAIWKTGEVIDDLSEGLEGNIAALRFDGTGKYFNVGKYDENINLIYSRTWPTRIEIKGDGVGRDLISAKPVGNQKGLGIMGFCYTPYHYVYDLTYPVLIQIYDGNEIFQFPVVVLIKDNLPREGIYSEIIEPDDFDLCKDMVSNIGVNLYDINLNKVDGNISFNCFNQECYLGETKEGTFAGNAPSCVNGYLVVDASGYAEKRQLFSSNSETSADIILDKKYMEEIELGMNGYGNAMVSFNEVNGTKSATAILPGDNEIELSEGNYEIRVYVYGNSSLTIPGSKKTQCQEVPRSGILGIFGAKREECFDISIPETKLDTVLIGGGKTNVYILPSDLEKGRIKVSVERLPTPSSMEQLAANFESIENGNVEIEFG